AAACAVACATAGAPAAATTGSRAASPSHSRFRVADGALGVNVAPWDGIYQPGARAAAGMQRMLKAAGVGMLHYGGGSWADLYDWRTDTDIKNCLPRHATASFTGRCSSRDPLDFARFSRQARAIGAASFATVNYGSGTPALAARWVADARTRPGEAVRLWEVGNESYGCWEVDNELERAPEHYSGYTPGTYTTVHGVHENATCPQATRGSAKGARILATSYAVNALRFLKAMKKADPAARIGVPWAFGTSVHGAAVIDAGEWNRSVLRTDGRYAGFVDARWYPFSFSGGTGGRNPTARRVLRTLFQIPGLYRDIRRSLDAYDPAADVVVGETGITNRESTAVCRPVGAVFAAGDVLSWLAAGARTVDWWDLNNYGNKTAACEKGDNGLFTSSTPAVPETPYWGYLLAAKLARPGARLAAIGVSASHAGPPPSRSVLAYESALPGGRRAVALVNTSTSSARKVTVRPFAPLSGKLRTWTYSARNQDATASRIVAGRARVASGAPRVTLPPESVRILETR
ncbi:MAG: hypothetical protein J2P25_09940, partial [Nocardiopsaceae bacterium]|nr:hypothetical protein [Nocardiopsaceae bacterium]